MKKEKNNIDNRLSQDQDVVLIKKEEKKIEEKSKNALDAQEYNRAVMHNFVARAVTRWSLEESKLFICALAQIRTHDEDGWVKLSKKDINRVLEYKSRSSNWLRKITKNIAQNSWLQFETETGWDDGFIVNRTRSDRWNIYIRFEKDYLPLLEQLTSHFTTVYAESIARLNHKSSYSLYLYLKSWTDPTGKISQRTIYKKDIQSIFNLDSNSYLRAISNGKKKFDWYTFESRCLIPAIEDINKNERGEVKILEVRKLRSKKNSKYIDGYHFTFRADNSFIESVKKPKLLRTESNKILSQSIKETWTLRPEDRLPAYEDVEKEVSEIGDKAPEVFRRLAEQHKKRTIKDWKAYVKKIAESLQNSSKKERSEELPAWYTYIPSDETLSPEYFLMTQLSIYELHKEDPYTSALTDMEDLVRKTGLSEEKILYYLSHRDELNEITSKEDELIRKKAQELSS